MLVSKVTCPECATVLRPAKPLPVGKKVKCPKCSNLFTAEAEAPEPVAASPAEGTKKKPAPVKAAAPEKPPEKKKKDDDEEDAGGTYGVIKEKEDLRKEQDDYDEDEDEDKPQISYAPDMSVKDLRGPAQAAVMRPSNALLFTGITGFLGWLAFLLMLVIGRYLPVQPDTKEGQTGDPHRPLAIIGPGFSSAAGSASGGMMGGGPVMMPGGGPGGPGGPGAAEQPKLPPKPAPKGVKEPPGFFELYGVELVPMADEAAYFFTILAIILIGMAYSCTLTYGGVQMQSLESRGWGIVSSVMAMVPLFNSGGLIMILLMILQIILVLFMEEFWWIGFTLLWLGVIQCLFSAAAGLWALLTCIDDDVIAGFEYEGE